MKKIICTSMLAAFMAVSSYASIVVQWSGVDGFVKNDGSTPLLNGGGDTVAILVFSASGSFWNTPLLAGSHVVGDEVILGSVASITYNPADPYGFVPVQNVNEPFAAGFIYARIFDEGTTSDPTSVNAGLYYYQGPSVATVNNTDPTAPDQYNMNTGSAAIPGFNTDVLNRQVVVPEPSVLAFLGLGGLALAARRRFTA